MNLALTMIVKNEEAHLGRCLDSVRGLVDEIIVVDTGSTDGTAALARARGATVVAFPWTEDFSAARNASLAHATADWVLVLDADEALDPMDHGRILEACARADVAAYGVLIRSYLPDGAYTMMETQAKANPGTYAPASAYAHCGDTRAVRLFRRLPWVAFRGRIHECVDACFLERGLVFPQLDTVIHHFGFTLAPRVQAKKPIYLELARRDAEERPQDLPSLFNLLIQAATAEEWRLACDAAERYRRAAGSLSLPPTLLLTQATALQRLGLHETALLVYEELLQAHPGSLPGGVGKGVSLERLGRTGEARALFEACLEAQPGFTTASLDLADLHVRADDYAAARTVLQKGLETCTGDPALWGRLIRLGLEEGATEQAVRDAWEALQNCPGGGGGDWHQLVALFLLREGAAAEGREVLAQGLAAFPGHAGLARLLGSC